MPEPGTTCTFCRADLAATGGPAAGEVDPGVLLVILANNPGLEGRGRPVPRLRPEVRRGGDACPGPLPAFAQVGVPILPTPVRLFASDWFRGRGVTIAFLDAGFFAHPDLVEPEDRILRYVDVNRTGAGRATSSSPTRRAGTA